MPYSASFAMVAAIGLVGFLALDSILYLRYLLYSSPREVLPLARRIDSQISRAIHDAEQYVKTFDGENLTNEIKSQAKEIGSDFETRPPYPRITVAFFKRAIANFLLTVLGFAFLTMALAYHEKYCRPGTFPYGHNCTEITSFPDAVLHSFYYHSVIFQSLGDGEHGPKTILAQSIASIETLTAFFYFILILGGIYSTAAIVRDNMTPKIFRESLEEYLDALCAPKKPKGIADIETLRSRQQG